MILLNLELRPVSLANKLLFWMVLKAVLLASAVLSLFLAPLVVLVVLLVFYALSCVGYYFSVHRLSLAVFLLAAKATETAEGQPVGRPPSSPEVIT